MTMTPTMLFAPLAGLLLTSPCLAVVFLADGAIHEIDTASADHIYIGEDPGGDPTTLILQPGGEINGSDGDDDSVSFFGRTIGIFNGGSIAEDLYAEGQASITVTDGTFNDDFQLFDEASAIIYGGTIHGDIELLDDSYLEILGGTFVEDLEVDSMAVIRGGSFLMQGIEYGLATAGGTIVLDGSGFALDGAPVDFGDLAALSGNLTGTLADGTALDVTVNRNPWNDVNFIGTITLVPEPSTCALALLAGVSMASVRRRPSAS